MRRFSAISLLLFLTLPALMPLTVPGQDEDASLPMCCRRHGGMRHHCAMMTAYLASRTPGSKAMATPVPCPDCPGAVPCSIHFQPGLSSVPVRFGGIGAYRGIHAQSEARARITLDRAWRKRGPPVDSLL